MGRSRSSGLLAGVACAALLVLGRRFRRRRALPPADPAEELRRKLAATRASGPEPDGQAAPPEPAIEPAAEPSLEERRRVVHERGRAAAERMRAGGDPPGERLV